MFYVLKKKKPKKKAKTILLLTAIYSSSFGATGTRPRGFTTTPPSCGVQHTICVRFCIYIQRKMVEK